MIDSGVAADPQTKTARIDFRQFPPAAGGFSQLFFDFIYSFEEVSAFYPWNFRNEGDLVQAFSRAVQAPRSRDVLVTSLLKQNASWKCSARTMENIHLFNKPTTLAVVTGQQVGLFGGPLYTIYKTITALKLAQQFKQKFPQYEFVPVFWLDGEDHDFSEMNHIGLFGNDGTFHHVEYLHEGIPTERNLGPVGDLRFSDSLDDTLRNLEASLKKTEFTEALLESVRREYHPGRTFLDAFVGWMNFLFEDSGLVFVSARDSALKGLCVPVFEKEITEFPATSQLIIRQSAVLEERYHAQIKPRSINLFMFHKTGRYLIEPREHDFSLRGTRHFISKEEMTELVRTKPELFSPNVVLRPIVQDTLFPTAAYVAGPSEIAYHAQIRPVYDRFAVAPPPLYPRASGSIIEERVERLLEKYHLELSSLFEDSETVTRNVLQQIAGVNIDNLFSSAQKRVHEAISELRFGLQEIDRTLSGPVENALSRIEGSLDSLRVKAYEAQKRRNETAVRQMERGVESLLPNGNLQERELSIIYYMNKYGPDLVKWLSHELEIGRSKHQILTL